MDLNDGSVPVPVETNADTIVSLVSVSLPVDGLEFTVNLTQEFDISRLSIRTTSPDVTIADHSVVLVKSEIIGIPEVKDIKFSDKFSDYAEQSLQPIDHIPGVESPGAAILVLRTQDRQCGSSEDFEHYAICPGRTGAFVVETSVEQEIVIKLYGKAAPDSYGEYEFTVEPTLKISVVRADWAY